MTVEWINLLQWGLASACMTAGLILAPRKRLRSLAALLWLFAIHMVFNALEETRVLPRGWVITPMLGLLYGPLLYFFVRRLIVATAMDWRRAMLHFIPALIALFVTTKLEAVRAVTLVSFAVYGVIIVRLIARYHVETASTRSDAASIRLSWITQVFAGFAGLTILDAIRLLTRTWQSPFFETTAYAAVLVAGGALLGALVWKAVTQPDHFKGMAKEPAPLRRTLAPAAESGDAALFERIESTILEGNLHRQPYLTLSDVASATNLSERDVSRAINSNAKRSFCDYINAFRVRDVCEALNSRKDETVLAIAFDAGFTSKSSFNAVFKKETGVTPTGYRGKKTSKA